MSNLQNCWCFLESDQRNIWIVWRYVCNIMGVVSLVYNLHCSMWTHKLSMFSTRFSCLFWWGHICICSQIPVVADLPVGENLQDHLVLGLAHCINQSISITLEKATSLSSMLQYQILGTGNMFQNLVSLVSHWYMKSSEIVLFANITTVLIPIWTYSIVLTNFLP